MKSNFALILLSFFVASEVLANNFFIPNYYRNRRTPNNFSAIGWSDRHEASVEMKNDSSKEKEAGFTNRETDTKEMNGKVFHKLDSKLTLEAFFRQIDEEEENFVFVDEDKTKTHLLSLGVGYELPTAPIALGVGIRNVKSQNEDQGTGLKSNSESKLLALGAGYRLDNNIFLGLGYYNIHIDFSNFGGSTSHIYSFGGGKVYGDLKKPDAAVETIFLWSNENRRTSINIIAQGLVNLDSMQVYGAVSSGATKERDSSQDDSTSGMLMAGLDYQFGNFYIGPQANYDVTENEGSTSADETDLLLSLEGGFRTEQLEIFARLGKTSNKEKNPPSISPDDVKLEGTDYALGATYFF